MSRDSRLEQIIFGFFKETKENELIGILKPDLDSCERYKILFMLFLDGHSIVYRPIESGHGSPNISKTL